MSFYFQDQTSPKLKTYIDRGAVVLVPLGTIEEHGNHVPVGADMMMAEDTSRDIAKAWNEQVNDPPMLVLPAFWSGYSMHLMKAWPGTITVRPRVVLEAMTDIVVSLIDMGFYRIVVSNNHGHHDGIIRQLARDVADLRNVWIAVFQPTSFCAEKFSQIRKSAPGGAIHGGEFETSILLHYDRPVDMSKLTNIDHMKYSNKFCPADGWSGSKSVIWSTWGLQPSKTGIYGDPTVASKETGKQVAQAIVENAIEFLKEFCRVTKKPEK